MHNPYARIDVDGNERTRVLFTGYPNGSLLRSTTTDSYKQPYGLFEAMEWALAGAIATLDPGVISALHLDRRFSGMEDHYLDDEVVFQLGSFEVSTYWAVNQWLTLKFHQPSGIPTEFVLAASEDGAFYRLSNVAGTAREGRPDETYFWIDDVSAMCLLGEPAGSETEFITSIDRHIDGSLLQVDVDLWPNREMTHGLGRKIVGYNLQPERQSSLLSACSSNSIDLTQCDPFSSAITFMPPCVITHARFPYWSLQLEDLSADTMRAQIDTMLRGIGAIAVQAECERLINESRETT